MGGFERSCTEPYLPVLEPKKADLRYSWRFFLDLGIKIEHKISNIQLYDKKDDLPFWITRTPHLTSNIASKCFILLLEDRYLKYLLPWRESVLIMIKQKNKKPKQKIQPKQAKPILSDPDAKSHYEALHKRFAVVTID